MQKTDKEKYVAYVGSYSYTGKAKGITIMDVNVERGVLVPRCEVALNNSSYVVASPDQRFLYSIADEGVVSFHIEPDGSLKRINDVYINGMRGRHLSVDPLGHYLMVSGYHDGKLTVLQRRPDGSIGHIVAEDFHKGLGGLADRAGQPHITCSRMSPDRKYILAADPGLDQVSVYRFKNRQIKLEEVIHCEINSSPSYFRWSPDGKYLYLLYEQKVAIDVFSYRNTDHGPIFEKIQTVSTVGKNSKKVAAATRMRYSPDKKHLFVGNAGDETITIFARDEESGMLTQLCCTMVSGEYPKDLMVFPDDRHVASFNHDSGTITFFEYNYETRVMLMSAREIKCNEPNCCALVKLPTKEELKAEKEAEEASGEKEKEEEG